MRTVLPRVLAAVLSGVLAAADGSAASATGAHPAAEVIAIFERHCFSCHGASGKAKGDFHMDTRERMLEGGEDYRNALVPGDAERSVMHRLMLHRPGEDMPMPPAKQGKLPDAQIAAVKAWIEAGAPWPDGYRLSASVAATATGGAR